MFCYCCSLSETGRIRRFRRVESTASNRELGEFFGPHRAPGRELSEFRSFKPMICVLSFSQNSPSLPRNSVSSLFRNCRKQHSRNSIPSFSKNKSAQQMRDSTVAVRRVQTLSVTVPLSEGDTRMSFPYSQNTLRKGVFLPSKHLLSAFYDTPPSKNPSKNLFLY